MLQLLFYVALLGYWIYCLVNWDGKRHCDNDCNHCPFPPCKDDDPEDETDD